MIEMEATRFSEMMIDFQRIAQYYTADDRIVNVVFTLTLTVITGDAFQPGSVSK
jgi:hypothetical protein